MQSKLLVGGRTIIDRTNEQEKALEAKRKEIREQLKRERDMKQKLEKREESALEAQESYTSLRQEVDIKTKKLKKVYLLSYFGIGSSSLYISTESFEFSINF